MITVTLDYGFDDFGIERKVTSKFDNLDLAFQWINICKRHCNPKVTLVIRGGVENGSR